MPACYLAYVVSTDSYIFGVWTLCNQKAVYMFDNFFNIKRGASNWYSCNKRLLCSILCNAV